MPREVRYELLPDHLLIHYGIEGAVITATQEFQGEEIPIGRGTVANGWARLDFVVKPLPSVPILLSASKPNYIGTRLTNSEYPVDAQNYLD